jgi:hypothetical protein
MEAARLLLTALYFSCFYACLPAHPPACLPACLCVCLPACLQAKPHYARPLRVVCRATTWLVMCGCCAAQQQITSGQRWS